MPHINRIRVNNVKYNFGTQYYDDFVMRFSGKNTIYDLANGGGKSVLMLLLLQNLIPNCTLDEKQPIEKLFRSGNGNTAIHSMIEWKLNPCHVKNGFQYMTTGFCARKAKGTGLEEGDISSDKAAIDYFNYCIFYRQFNENDLKNLPLSNGKERITYLGLRSYLQELEKKDLHVQVKIFDRKGEYQSFISQYGLFESEWEIIRGINKTEGHVRTYFETNYRTTRKVVEDLLIEEIIEKSFYHKTGTDREAGRMANTLLDLKEQLVLLSKKKSEIHYYDRQTELLSEFASRMGNLKGMYSKKQGLEEQLIKTYNTTLLRREQKEHAHEALVERGELLEREQQEISCRIDSADICKKEYELNQLTKTTEEKEQEIQTVTALCDNKKEQLNEWECDNYYLNYLEYEKEYLAARQAVEAILSGSHMLAEDLCALANELDACTKKEETQLAERIQELNEETEDLAQQLSEMEEEQKTKAVTGQVLAHRMEQLEAELSAVREEIGTLAKAENLLFLTDLKGQCAAAEQAALYVEKQSRQVAQKLEQNQRELLEAEVEIRNCQKEDRRVTSELEALGTELRAHKSLKERMEQLIGIYGGTYQSIETVIFRQQKELVLIHQKHIEEQKRLQAKLQALSEGISMPQPQMAAVYLEEIARYYDGEAITGYEYLQGLEPEERESLEERFPQLCCSVVTSADLETIASDRKLREKDLGDVLLPIISRKALEGQKELFDENSMIFLGRKERKEKIKERLETLEELLAKEYERERALQQDYNFVQAFLRACEAYEPKQAAYDALKKQWKSLEADREALSLKIREANDRENALNEEKKELEAAFKNETERVKNYQRLVGLEERRIALESELLELTGKKQEAESQIRAISLAKQRMKDALQSARRSLKGSRESLNQLMVFRESFLHYTNEQGYTPCGLERKELEAAFLGKKTAYEQKNSDISDKQKLMDSCMKAMEQQKEQLQLRGTSLETMQEKLQKAGCIHTDTEVLLLAKQEVFEIRQRLAMLQKEKNALDVQIHKFMGSIQHAKQLAQDNYGEILEMDMVPEQLGNFVVQEKARLKAIRQERIQGQTNLRQLEEQCYALKAMAQDMERMMKSAGISKEEISECLETGMSLKEQYEELRQAYEKIVREESKKLEHLEKEKQQLLAVLGRMDAHELAREIEQNIQAPEHEGQIEEQLKSLADVIGCLELEKERIGKDMDSLQELKDQFETQCLQSCLNMKEELDRLQKLSKISMDQKMISMITLQIPYIKEELYKDAMAGYIDGIIRQVENFDSQAEQLNFIRSQLSFKRLFAVIVTNMDAIRLTLYKRERMKEQSRYLKYEEAVGSTGQSQGIYIQFLVAIINYISSINSKNADPLDLKKVIFIDNPFGAAKDVYIWEPIFKLLKANNVQLIVPARGATPAITGHFDVNYILGQKLIDGRQQTVVVDYRSQTQEHEMEYETLAYEQETLQFT